MKRLARNKAVTVCALLLSSLLLTGCLIDKNDPMSWHPISIAAAVTAETVGFTYRAMADGEVAKIQLEGKQVETSEAFPCFVDPSSIQLSYAYYIMSEEKFDERVIWQRGEYIVETEREIGAGQISALFPVDKVEKELGLFWAGIWKAELIVKGESRRVFTFRLASSEAKEQLLAEASALDQIEDYKLCSLLEQRADSCWPETIMRN